MMASSSKVRPMVEVTKFGLPEAITKEISI